MAINRASIAKELLPVLMPFGLEYVEVSDEHALFEVENSDRAFEERGSLHRLRTAPVKGEGAAVSYDDASESFTSRYTHETIAGFAVQKKLWKIIFMTHSPSYVPVWLVQWLTHSTS